MSSSEDENEVCCTCCWRPTSTRDERGPLVASSGKRSTQNGRSTFRMQWSGHSRAEPREIELQPVQEGITFRFRSTRYCLGAEIGRGAHCTVWQCQMVGSHSRDPPSFALKLHNEEATALKREVGALRALSATSSGVGLFPQVLGTVRIARRTGLALSLHGPDLYHMQKQLHRQPFPRDFVWNCARQLLSALHALEQAKLVHADIKPQNILLHDSEDTTLEGSTRIVLIDLGSCLSREQLDRTRNQVVYVQSRWYRAPEVILCSPLSYPADTWSVGCVIAEVALGVPLLPGESEYNQIARIQAMLGAPPLSLVRRARCANEYFDDVRRGVPTLRSERAEEEPDLIRYLPYNELKPLLRHMLPKYPESERLTLFEVLDGLLRWDPEDRWCAESALGRLELMM